MTLWRFFELMIWLKYNEKCLAGNSLLQACREYCIWSCYRNGTLFSCFLYFLFYLNCLIIVIEHANLIKADIICYRLFVNNGQRTDGQCHERRDFDGQGIIFYGSLIDHGACKRYA